MNDAAQLNEFMAMRMAAKKRPDAAIL